MMIGAFDQGSECMSEDIEQWHQIATLLHEALPEIDSVLSEANVSISDRKLKAFEIVRETMLEVSDEMAFLTSDARGRFLVIIAEWYRERYGSAVEMDDDDQVVAVAMVHNTPFLLRVPKTFKLPPDDEGHIWLGFPASVQKEENPLGWLENQAVVKALGDAESQALREATTRTANLVVVSASTCVRSLISRTSIYPIWQAQSAPIFKPGPGICASKAKRGCWPLGGTCHRRPRNRLKC
jgi:hypothetical protein